MYPQMIFLLAIFGFKAVTCDDVEVHLYPYKYKDTKCTSGILVDMPLHLEGIIRLPGDIKELGIYINAKRKEQNKKDFEIFDVIFNNCEISQQFFCKPFGNTTMYGLYVHAKATVNISESEWKIKGRYRETDFESETVRVPKIFDVSDIKMTVNGQEWSIGNTSLSLTSDQLTICCIPDDAPWPCEAVISVNSQPPEFGSPCVTHTIDTSMERTLAEVKFGFRVCGNDTFSQIYSPGVLVEAKSVIGNASYNETWILGGAGVALVIVVILVLLVVYIKDVSGQRIQSDEPSSQPFLPQQNHASHKPSTVNVEHESCIDGKKSKKKGKKNKGKKPSEAPEPEASKPAVTRARSNSESETIRQRKGQDTRKMKTK